MGDLSYDNFYPRSPCGERLAEKLPAQLIEQFLSTLSLRRATVGRYSDAHARGNFYPRSPCGERPPCPNARYDKANFYPRSPCGERPPVRVYLPHAGGFLSTLSLRRATLPARRISTMSSDFYPRSPCGERPPRGGYRYLDKLISIHALLAESDRFRSWPIPRNRNFYPRSPCGERPELDTLANNPPFISIHALLAESDSTAFA